MGGVGEKRENRIRCRDLCWILRRLLSTRVSRGEILELMTSEGILCWRFYKVGGQCGGDGGSFTGGRVYSYPRMALDLEEG
jgi:hypothetical protein